MLAILKQVWINFILKSLGFAELLSAFRLSVV